jgi:hypothetical protein
MAGIEVEFSKLFNALPIDGNTTETITFMYDNQEYKIDKGSHIGYDQDPWNMTSMKEFNATTSTNEKYRFQINSNQSNQLVEKKLMKRGGRRGKSLKKRGSRKTKKSRKSRKSLKKNRK